MANAFLNLAKSTRLPAIYRAACAQARIPTEDGTENIASTDDHENEALIFTVNECQREFFNEFPMLNVTAADITVTADQRHSLLPEDLRDTDIFRLYWNDGGTRDGVNIPFKAPAEIQLLGTEWTADDQTADYPEFAVMAWELESDRGKIDWYRMPGTDRTARLLYRAQETQFEVSDLTAASGSGNICSVPDRLIPVFILFLAAELCDFSQDGSSTHGQFIRAKRDKKVSDWQRRLAMPLASLVNDTADFGKFPRTQSEVGIYTMEEDF